MNRSVLHGLPVAQPVPIESTEFDPAQAPSFVYPALPFCSACAKSRVRCRYLLCAAQAADHFLFSTTPAGIPFLLRCAFSWAITDFGDTAEATPVATAAAKTAARMI